MRAWTEAAVRRSGWVRAGFISTNTSSSYTVFSVVSGERRPPTTRISSCWAVATGPSHRPAPTRTRLGHGAITMKRTHLLGGLVTAALLAVGGVGIATALPDPPPTVAPAALSSARIGAAMLTPGTALVDAGGRALYLFEAD